MSKTIEIVDGRRTKDHESVAPATGGGRGYTTTRIKLPRSEVLRRITQGKPKSGR